MTEFFSAIATLLLVMDPLGNVPAFLACLKDMEVMIFASRRPDQLWQTGAATTVAWIATVAILMFSPALSRVLGRRGLVACGLRTIDGHGPYGCRRADVP
jgi:small neutral amino acid transporter SnatA (MarC family)